MEVLKGIGVSPGFVIAEAFLLNTEDVRIPRRFVGVNEVPGQIERLMRGLRITRKQMNDIREQAKSLMSDKYSTILDVSTLLLDDQTLINNIKERIEQDRLTAEYAISRVFRRYIKSLENLDDDFFSLRVIDLKDVERRLIKNIVGDAQQDLSHLDTSIILVATELTPSQTVSLDKALIHGFATDSGGRTSHSAILARAMQIPAVVGLGKVTTEVSGGDTVILDGSNGIVIIGPDEVTIQKYQARERSFHYLEKKLTELKDLPAATGDGVEIQLLANIEFPEEIPTAIGHGAEGVGLYRTEFLYLQDGVEPGEAEHFGAYRSAAQKLSGRPLTLRTMDLGADKLSPFITGTHTERNPFLGCRSIRLCYERTHLIKTQLRAILRASVFGNIKILFPMISSLEELLWAKEVLEDVKESLEDEGVPFEKDIPVGVMIEVPSAAMIVDVLAEESDFFSIGTNDLVQYTLAVDRGNERVSRLYQPSHLAVLRLMRRVIACGKATGTPISICGEISGDVLYTILLVGMGLNEFSSSAVMIPEVKKIIRSIRYDEAKELANEVFGMRSNEKIMAFMREETQKIIPEAFGL